MVNGLGYLWDAIQHHPFNALTLVIAAGALIVSLHALNASKRQAKAAERQAAAGEETVRLQASAIKSQADEVDKALEIAERNAKAAEASAESTKLLIELGERPWINHVKTFPTFRETSIGGCHLVADCQIRNGGKTPAVELQINIWLKLVSGQVPDDLGLPLVNRGSKAVLAPQREAHARTEKILSPTEVAAIEAGTMLLYLYGCAAYQDILHKDHRTAWCQTFEPTTQSFAYSDKHNFMD